MEEIRSNPSRYVMLFRPSMLESDFGGSLPDGSRCLYSRWSGYLDRPDWQPVKAALAKAKGDLSRSLSWRTVSTEEAQIATYGQGLHRLHLGGPELGTPARLAANGTEDSEAKDSEVEGHEGTAHYRT